MIRRAILADAPAIARIHVQSWQETYRGLVPDDYLNRLTVTDRERGHERQLAYEDGTATFLALDPTPSGGAIPVGFAYCGRARGAPGPGWGEIFALYLLDRAKGRGHGRDLMAASSDWFAERGGLPFMLWALTANFRATGFYRHLGGEPYADRLERFSGAVLPESAFRFDARIAPTPRG
jgi:GNAT superfamily N-acetyltransferase